MLEKTVILPAIHQMGKNRRSTVSEQTHTGHVTPGIKSCSWEGDSTKTLHRGHVLVFEKGATPDLCVCVSTRVSASIFFLFFFCQFLTDASGCVEVWMCISFTSRQTKIMRVKKRLIKKICIRGGALTLSVHTQTHVHTHT